MSSRSAIVTDLAPPAIGPYSQAVSVRNLAGMNLIFVSGQLPIDLKTKQLLQGDIKLLTRQVLQNLEAILQAAGSSLAHVLRTDIFLVDLKRDFQGMNEEYALWFKGDNLPARQTVQVVALPMQSLVEISCIAF